MGGQQRPGSELTDWLRCSASGAARNGAAIAFDSHRGPAPAGPRALRLARLTRGPAFGARPRARLSRSDAPSPDARLSIAVIGDRLCGRRAPFRKRSSIHRRQGIPARVRLRVPSAPGLIQTPRPSEAVYPREDTYNAERARRIAAPLGTHWPISRPRLFARSHRPHRKWEACAPARPRSNGDEQPSNQLDQLKRVAHMARQ